MGIIEEIKAEILALQKANNRRPVLRIGKKRFLELVEALKELQHKKPNAVIFIASDEWSSRGHECVLLSGCPVIFDESKDSLLRKKKMKKTSKKVAPKSSTKKKGGKRC